LRCGRSWGASAEKSRLRAGARGLGCLPPLNDIFGLFFMIMRPKYTSGPFPALAGPVPSSTRATIRFLFPPLTAIHYTARNSGEVSPSYIWMSPRRDGPRRAVVQDFINTETLWCRRLACPYRSCRRDACTTMLIVRRWIYETLYLELPAGFLFGQVWSRPGGISNPGLCCCGSHPWPTCGPGAHAGAR
jgi:hypothetical protein